MVTMYYSVKFYKIYHLLKSRVHPVKSVFLVCDIVGSELSV